MGETLEKTGPYRVKSTCGYVVEFENNRGVVYRDEIGEAVIGHSWLGSPSGVSLHPGTLLAKGVPRVRADLITIRAMRALEYLGYYVERF